MKDGGITRPPSEYFYENIYVTYQDDHAATMFPSGSNSSTGGAATHSDLSSFGCSVEGRCTIHTWSRESTATPTTAPMIHWFGSWLGHSGSTWNCGTWSD